MLQHLPRDPKASGGLLYGVPVVGEDPVAEVRRDIRKHARRRPCHPVLGQKLVHLCSQTSDVGVVARKGGQQAVQPRHHRCQRVAYHPGFPREVDRPFDNLQVFRKLAGLCEIADIGNHADTADRGIEPLASRQRNDRTDSIGCRSRIYESGQIQTELKQIKRKRTGFWMMEQVIDLRGTSTHSVGTLLLVPLRAFYA